MKSQNHKQSATWVQDQGCTAWLTNDPRSAAAMLRGKGDDRFALYEKYCEIKRLEDPTISLEQLDEDYHNYVVEKEAVWVSQGKSPSLLQAMNNSIGSWLATRLFPIVTLSVVMQWAAKHF
jgi:hypothetical protein